MKKFMVFAASCLWRNKFIGWILAIGYFLMVILVGLNPNPIIKSGSPRLLIFLLVLVIFLILLISFNFQDEIPRNILKKANEILINTEDRELAKKLESLIQKAKQDKKKISDLKNWLDKFEECKALKKEIPELEEEENAIKKERYTKEIRLSNLGIQLII